MSIAIALRTRIATFSHILTNIYRFGSLISTRCQSNFWITKTLIRSFIIEIIWILLRQMSTECDPQVWALLKTWLTSRSEGRPYTAPWRPRLQWLAFSSNSSSDRCFWTLVVTLGLCGDQQSVLNRLGWRVWRSEHWTLSSEQWGRRLALCRTTVGFKSNTLNHRLKGLNELRSHINRFTNRVLLEFEKVTKRSSDSHISGTGNGDRLPTRVYTALEQTCTQCLPLSVVSMMQRLQNRLRSLGGITCTANYQLHCRMPTALVVVPIECYLHFRHSSLHWRLGLTEIKIFSDISRY